MKIQITYLNKGVTQIFLVVEQELFDKVRKAEEAISNKKEFKLLTEDKKLELNGVVKELGWILGMHKNGEICTTESAIFTSHKEGKGILKIQEYRFPVETKVIEE